MSVSLKGTPRYLFFKACDLQPERPCQTDGFLLEGAQGWSPTMYIRLVQDFGLECEVAQHLSKSYGDRAFAVAKMASLTGKRWPIIGKKIHPEFPYIDAEVSASCAFKAQLTIKPTQTHTHTPISYIHFIPVYILDTLRCTRIR